MIRFRHKGDFRNTERFFKNAPLISPTKILDKYGKAGVDALAASTPVRTGKTASSWSYEIVQKPGKISIYWTNSNFNEGVNIAVILQYGHGTGTGGFVQGIDYINPAIRPIFETIANEAWKEVTSS